MSAGFVVSARSICWGLAISELIMVQQMGFGVAAA